MLKNKLLLISIIIFAQQNLLAMEEELDEQKHLIKYRQRSLMHEIDSFTRVPTLHSLAQKSFFDWYYTELTKNIKNEADKIDPIPEGSLNFFSQSILINKQDLADYIQNKWNSWNYANNILSELQSYPTEEQRYKHTRFLLALGIQDIPNTRGIPIQYAFPSQALMSTKDQSVAELLIDAATKDGINYNFNEFLHHRKINSGRITKILLQKGAITRRDKIHSLHDTSTINTQYSNGNSLVVQELRKHGETLTNHNQNRTLYVKSTALAQRELMMSVFNSSIEEFDMSSREIAYYVSYIDCLPTSFDELS